MFIGKVQSHMQFYQIVHLVKGLVRTKRLIVNAISFSHCIAFLHVVSYPRIWTKTIEIAVK